MSVNDENSPIRKRTPRGCAGIFFVFVVICAAGWGTALGFFVSLLEDAQNEIEVIESFRPKVGSKFYADPATGGELLGEYTIDYRQLLQLHEIPLYVQKAFLAGEDHTFFEHWGVRPDAMIKAALRTMRTGQLHGGSTITQQTVRNLEDKLVGREQTMQRKLREMLISLQIEREYTKDEILELYLNQIFLGGSAYGVEAAARQYFGKRCDELTLGEAAILAGIAPAPNSYRPDLYPRNAYIQRNRVLNQMLDNGFISQAEFEEARAESIQDSIITPEERLTLMAEGRGYWGPNRFQAEYFVEEARQRIMGSAPGSQQLVTRQELLEGGLEIYTTIDMNLQRAAEEVLLTALDEFDERKLESLRASGRENEFVPVSGALVTLDNRPGYEGYVRALVGGRDWSTQKFNTVTQAKRQPGSSVKPYVWTAAIAQGMTPAQLELDEPFVRIDPGSRRPWAPKNFDGRFMGPVTLRTALERSQNVISVKLVERLGLPLVKSYMQRAGIRQTEIPDHIHLSLALGAAETTILEQAIAYSTYAKNGTYAKPIFVKEIRTPDGFVSWENRIELEPNAIPANVAYVMTNLMQGVTQYGTGARTADFDRPRAGKTGTTNDHRDAWFCGYTPQYTTVVWIGYKDNRSLGRGLDYTGGRLASPIWTEFMIRAHENLPVEDFEVPDGVEFFNINKETGLANGSFREAFIEGTRPPRSMRVFPDADRLEELMEEELMDRLFTQLGSESNNRAQATPRTTATPSSTSPSNLSATQAEAGSDDAFGFDLPSLDGPPARTQRPNRLNRGIRSDTSGSLLP